MAKIILDDGSEEFVSPGDARKRVAAGEATFPKFSATYQTRELKAEETHKPKRKRRTKAEIAADEAKEAAEPCEDDAE